MKKIAEIKPSRAKNMTVYYDNAAKVNPYRVYLEWLEPTPHGLMPRRQQYARFSDLASAGYMMAEYGLKYNEDRR